MLAYDISSLKRPIQTEPEGSCCGDGTMVIEDENTIFLALFDGAGHGFPAHIVKQQALSFLKEHASNSLDEALKLLHENLKGSRGGVAGLCRINKLTGESEYTGIGNTMARICRPEIQRFINRGGILGYEITNPVISYFTIEPNNILFLYSDGVEDHFEMSTIPDLSTRSAEEISRIIIDYFSKAFDDASVIVVKVTND
ncbi:MAG: SpoIIE family protein phosphatase [Legionellaceae bacterium]|nr:SpoIIE family protein phosphatase [Legionellaceae bacterium]